MLTFQIFSLLLLPIIFLSLPILLFATKNRPEIAQYYLVTLALVQATVAFISDSQKLEGLPFSLHQIIIIILAISMLLGNLLSFLKTKQVRWLQYASLVLVLSGFLFIFA